jgi:hypothetical protein
MVFSVLDRLRSAGSTRHALKEPSVLTLPDFVRCDVLRQSCLNAATPLTPPLTTSHRRRTPEGAEYPQKQQRKNAHKSRNARPATARRRLLHNGIVIRSGLTNGVFYHSGKFIFFKNALYRGSPSRFLKFRSPLMWLREVALCAYARSSHLKASSTSPRNP